MTYRYKTNGFTSSRLDCVVNCENGELKYKRIGGFYYTAVILSACNAFGVSQLLG